MNIAIIPARGGSKRVPRKNIKIFADRPMIAHAITAAINCGLFEQVIVSTDDEEIASVSRSWGAKVPFMRPAELADDYTPTVPVVAHAIEMLQQQGVAFKNVCCIYPGVPFIQAGDLIDAFELLMSSNAGYCYPVTEFPSAVQRALRRNPDGCLQPINPQYEWTRTQDLEPAFFDAGQFYWGRVESWCNGLGLQSHAAGIVIPQWRVVDIDTHEDWARAEILFKTLSVGH